MAGRWQDSDNCTMTLCLPRALRWRLKALAAFNRLALSEYCAGVLESEAERMEAHIKAIHDRSSVHRQGRFEVYGVKEQK